MSRSYLLAAILAMCCVTESQGESAKPRNSLAFSCLDRPFISVFAAAPDRSTFPAVGLSLTDPLGRGEGYGVNGDGIPASSYGPVVEIPELPLRSRSLALELCNAVQGVYEIKVTELGNGPYRLGVRGNAKTENGETLLLHHTSEEGRVRHYRFRFRIEQKRLILRWLDKDDKEQVTIEESEW